MALGANGRVGRWAKRAVDLTVASAGLVAVSPVLLATAVAVRIGMGSPVMFRQVRAGRDGKPFRLFKFRTMRDAADASGSPLPDEQRLTALGRFMRSTSLDELPQLLNVLTGDMSLVGPRPLLMRYLPRYSPEQARRHEVPPGITGWAQVHGRNTVGWREKFAYDVWYVDHWSIALDLKILALTALRVVQRHGISAAGQATMPEFMGDEAEAPSHGA